MRQKTYNKTLLLCPSRYSLINIFKNILLEISDEVLEIDIRNYVKQYEIKLNTQMFRFPDLIRKKWISYYQQKINDKLWSDFCDHSPDVVFVYNNEMLLPSTVQKMKQTAKIIFFLGDSPFFTPTNDYFLTILVMGDLVLIPDSFWVQQMQNVGIKNSFYFIPGFDKSSYHMRPDKEVLQNAISSDILYCGSCYLNSWGYKKALFMSKFTKFDLHIYGNKNWEKWFEFFPDLESKYHQSGFIPAPILNAMFNKTKLMPVDGNPGILNGIHLRMFEALSAGVLPLVEYRKDVEESIFNGLDIEIPVIKTYDLAEEVAERYLMDESLRLSTVSSLRNHVLSQYSSEKNANRILSLLSGYNY
jgi:hypothetical protein